MASKRSLVPRNGRFRLFTNPKKPPGLSICPFCSFVPSARAAAKARSRRQVRYRRCESTSAATINPRVELGQTLIELQECIPNLVNLSRLQLALRGLRQASGEETVRVAIFGLASSSDGRAAARKILKALLVDPLVDVQEWERKLDKHDPSQPLIVRVGPSRNKATHLELSRENAPHELNISSVELDGLNLELLLMDIEVPSGTPGSVSVQALEEAVLVPTVGIASSEDRVTPLTTPVHRALLVADGLMGAVGVSALPVLESADTIMAVDLKGFSQEKLSANFVVIDTSLAEESVQLFRQSPQHAMEYEHRWSASNLGTLVTWVKAGTQATDDGTKPVIRRLIASVLQSALAAIETEETNKELTRCVPPGTLLLEAQNLNDGLAKWAQKAHSELQKQLDLAFKGRRWRKLGWWKLFWRVDDVDMLTNEILSQRFLPTAEQELVYLTGRIAQLQGEAGQYPQPVSSRKPGANVKLQSSKTHELIIPTAARSHLPKWPGHIAFTRRYIQNETVPALQSLAQNLVLQSLATSSLASCLAALLYISSVSSTLYEAGAVAALGIVYSLGRMQKKWEAAREFWEGEVREEGRKAVRAVEESAAQVLDGGKPNEASAQKAEELEKARELVAKAENALRRMK